MRVSLEPPHPLDWDHQSYCIEPRCTQPATHSRLLAMVDATPMYELVCCQHARRP